MNACKFFLLISLSLGGCATIQVNQAYKKHDVAIVMYNQFGSEIKDAPIYEEYVTSLNEVVRILNEFLVGNSTDIDARIILADSLLMLGDISTQLSYYREAEDEANLILAVLVPNQKQLARTCYYLAQAMIGDRSEAREHYDRLKACQPSTIVDLSMAEFQDFARHMEVLDRRFASLE